MEIRLTKGLIAIVDPEDYDVLRRYGWHAVKGRNTMYAGRGHAPIRMHNEIMKPPVGLFVDHINRDGLDNRRSNLRLVTASQNMANRRKFKNSTSRYRGVSFARNNWQASIRVDGKLTYLGRFGTPEEAARAYDRAAYHARGEYAVLNF